MSFFCSPLCHLHLWHSLSPCSQEAPEAYLLFSWHHPWPPAPFSSVHWRGMHLLHTRQPASLHPLQIPPHWMVLLTKGSMRGYAQCQSAHTTFDLSQCQMVTQATTCLWSDPRSLPRHGPVIWRLFQYSCRCSGALCRSGQDLGWSSCMACTSELRRRGRSSSLQWRTEVLPVFSQTRNHFLIRTSTAEFCRFVH